MPIKQFLYKNCQEAKSNIQNSVFRSTQTILLKLKVQTIFLLTNYQ